MVPRRSADGWNDEAVEMVAPSTTPTESFDGSHQDVGLLSSLFDCSRWPLCVWSSELLLSGRSTPLAVGLSALVMWERRRIEGRDCWAHLLTHDLDPARLE
jgi:hypothetical protein